MQLSTLYENTDDGVIIYVNSGDGLGETKMYTSGTEAVAAYLPHRESIVAGLEDDDEFGSDMLFIVVGFTEPGNREGLIHPMVVWTASFTIGSDGQTKLILYDCRTNRPPTHCEPTDYLDSHGGLIDATINRLRPIVRNFTNPNPESLARMIDEVVSVVRASGLGR